MPNLHQTILAVGHAKPGRRRRYGKNVEWMEKVSDEQYRR